MEMMGYTDKFFSAEEKASFLRRLRSDLQSTRFMCVKFLSMSILNKLLDLKRLASIDPVFFKDLYREVKALAEDENELAIIKKEAKSVLDSLKPFIHEGERENIQAPVECHEKEEEVELKQVCMGCNRLCDESWSFCPYCGERLQAEKKG
ncbi:MAG TPA: zinc ribbon domain-containing protein [Candidatus Syntrophoarchaeum butanivorans]|uniref:Replication restart DNA helicase PriA n=1 Tax=Candidatus Syntropharchaeum butanivorans TaxID=1839936 RepID=A0A1F2P5U5_9EURY|nr:MAG: replication restart DNA helicase PriA [Candidatus Syntrophoarchaeum butanivorans]HEC57699.1 zinc ribbon domain-containing protein [Candidatus Syntrophoarchaeum butanivorans]